MQLHESLLKLVDEVDPGHVICRVVNWQICANLGYINSIIIIIIIIIIIMPL